ncbi:MAG: hypothetical protein IPM47_04225 [Sphingobacteriales bacterium]|nr:MAG: hypothetical protein IPM47_04225 [Sphingobacteriales bacterium]
MKSQPVVIVVLCLLMAISACNQKSDPDQKTNTKTNPSTSAAASWDSPLPKVQQILANCVKVEYLLYDMGISFETESNEEVMRFFSYIMDQPANVTNCKPGKYDGSVVFKDNNGDIKLGMELNILNGCNRVSVPVEGKKYEMPLNENGLGFFNQILRMRSKAETE